MHERRHDAAQALARWQGEAAGVTWEQGFTAVGPSEPGPDAAWFPGGRLSVSANCVDRHAASNGDRVALHFEGEPGDRLTLTYRELAVQVERLSAALSELGVGLGDRVALYLGMVPEMVVAMLACARLGAVHTVLPSALPAEALADRLSDFAPLVLLTQDGAWRHGVMLPLKARSDEALSAVEGVEHTVVVRRTGIDVAWYAGDLWYHDIVARRDTGPPPVAVAADHPLLVTYLGNRRGRPVGFVHRSAGLLVYALALHRAMATSPRDVYWCAVDIGWMAGQTHGVYGPLAAGATTVLYEGTLDTPSHDRAWTIIERYQVDALVTTPSIVRSLHQWVDSPPAGDRLASLRHIVTAGEAIEQEVLDWLATEVGGGRALLRDGWGQTELGAVVTVTPDAQPPLPDPGLDVIDEGGRPVPVGEVGDLVLRNPWPGQFLGLHGADEGDWTSRYWTHPGMYATGDLARRAADGSIELLGRRDPVIQVLGQLVSANEVAEVLTEHPYVERAEVVGQPDARRGHVVAAGVVLSAEARDDGDLAALGAELRAHVEETLGGLARPRTVAVILDDPSDVQRGALRRALALLCRDRTEATFTIAGDQLRAAITAAGD